MNYFKINIGQSAILGRPMGDAFITFEFKDRFSTVKLTEFKNWIDDIVESKGNRSEKAYAAKKNLDNFFNELFI